MGTTVLKDRCMLLAAVFLCIISTAPADAGETEVTLRRAVEVSLLNNGELKAFREEKGLHDAARTRAGTLPNPTLDIEASTGAMTGSSGENTLSVGISQEFSLSGKREKRLTVAEREMEIYRWQLANRERLLSDGVKTAFYDALLAKERVALAERSISLNRQLFEVAKERLNAGDIPELEMNLVKVELARSEAAGIDAAKTMLLSQAGLEAMMGLNPGTLPAIAGNLGKINTMTKPLSDLRHSAAANRPDLKAFGAESGHNEAGIAAAEAESLPDLTVGLSYTREQRMDETASGREKVRDNILGIRLSMPVPLFDRNRADIQEARARKSSCEARLNAAARAVERETETAYASYRNAESLLSLYKADIIPQLEENLQLTLEAYRLGEVGILSVIQEQKKFAEVYDSYLTALHYRQTALVKLETATASELIGGEK